MRYHLVQDEDTGWWFYWTDWQRSQRFGPFSTIVTAERAAKANEHAERLRFLQEDTMYVYCLDNHQDEKRVAWQREGF